MNEESHRKSQIRISVLEILVNCISLIVGVSVGLWQFNKQQESQKNIEFQRTVWQIKLDTYQTVSKAVGSIISTFGDSNTTDTIFLKKNIQAFEELYWGELNFIDDSTITEKAKNFRALLKNGDLSIDTDKENLKILGNDLVQACRKSSLENLKVLMNE